MGDEASLEQGQADQQDQQESSSHDWEKDYKELQATYTREQQKLTDEQALLAHIQEKFPHLVTEDDEHDEPDEDEPDPDLVDDEDPRFQKLTQLEQRQQAHDEWIATQSQKDATAQFNSDLTEEAGDRELSRQAREWIFNETIKLGDGRENLKKATQAWIEFEDGLGAQYLERVKKSKRAPHVPAGGKTATGTKPVEDMTRAELNEYMTERALGAITE